MDKFTSDCFGKIGQFGSVEGEVNQLNYIYQIRPIPLLSYLKTVIFCTVHKTEYTRFHPDHKLPLFDPIYEPIKYHVGGS